MKTTHKIFFQDSKELKNIPSESVDLVVTSPPYPMIDMWDDMYGNQNPSIQIALENGDGKQAYALIHEILDSVWDEVFRVLKSGRFACINIGDATRTVKNDFCLYPNHARILTYLLNIGFSALPDILWRKQANTPNKFMGSGMLPAGAYVTLEHEYILIVRKGSKREFKTEDEKENRRESALFWEERNIWYSDIWTDIKGTKQKLSSDMPRLRSAAFPYDLAYRLINMYSVKGDVILDPFLGTGTTIAAAMTSARNSVGVEIDKSFQQTICPITHHIVEFSNDYLPDRLLRHFEFVKNRIQDSGPLKYTNRHYSFPVVTSQEQFILLNGLKEVQVLGDNIFEVMYSLKPQVLNFDQLSESLIGKKMKSYNRNWQPIMHIFPAYQEIVDFIAAGTTSQNLVDFCPSEVAKERISDMIHHEKTTGLAAEETVELNHCLQLEHLMRLAKSRARQYLKNE